MLVDEYYNQRSENSFQKGIGLLKRFRNIFDVQVPCHKRIDHFIFLYKQELKQNAFNVKELKYLSRWHENKKHAIQNKERMDRNMKPITYHRASSEQMEKLDKMKIVHIVSQQTRWNNNYKKLVEYKQTYGSVKVTKTNDKSLYMWLYHQKKAFVNNYRIKNGSKPLSNSRINDDQIDKLLELGVMFK